MEGEMLGAYPESPYNLDRQSHVKHTSYPHFTVAELRHREIKPNSHTL